MADARWIALAGSLTLLACPSGDDDNTSTSVSTTIASTTTTGPSESSSGPGETSTGVAESSSGPMESSGVADSSTGEACPADAECMDDSMCPGGGMCVGCLCVGGNQCDPIVKGEWNACVDENGQTDNTLCNWMGMGGAQGFIGCLNSSQMDGSNVCFISDCVDACDCFAPPTTGTAEVVCKMMLLADGGSGCALDCSMGKTCPDGMECQNDICFWPGMPG
jgi:hypothetical protein